MTQKSFHICVLRDIFLCIHGLVLLFIYIDIDLIEVQVSLNMVLSLFGTTPIIFTHTMIYKLLVALEVSSTFCIF